jgi:hypothetical protein
MSSDGDLRCKGFQAAGVYSCLTITSEAWLQVLRDTIETGDVRYKDETRIWIAKHFGDRADNLLCVVAVLETALVVKTVMHHFSWESGL